MKCHALEAKDKRVENRCEKSPTFLVQSCEGNAVCALSFVEKG